MLWISDYIDVCSKCKKNNYKLFPVDEEIYRHPNCRCKQLYFNDVGSKAKRYLIVIFAGINTEENNPSMLALGEQLKQKLLERNNENTVDIEQIAPYAADVFDGLKVFQHAHFTTKEVNRFTNQVIAKYSSGTYDFVLFIGYSGGGVMASRVAENINYRVPIDKIIRIGSPDLYVNKNDYANITYDISLLKDTIPNFEFWRINGDNIRIDDEILTGYVINDKGVHLSYFTQDRDAFGVSNLDKTVNAILGQTG